MSIRVHPPIHPGEVLREEFMAPLGLTGYALGKALGVPRTRIERLAAGQTPITPDTAIRLGRYFGTSPDFWMNLQMAFDLTVAEEKGREQFDRILPRNAAA